MNTQNNIKLGDVWEELTKKKTYTRARETDNIIMRCTQAKSGQIRFSMQIGIDICDIFKWKKGDILSIMRNKLNGTFLKVSKSSLNGLKLTSPTKNAGRLNLWGTFDYHKKYILENTKIVSFELNKDYLIVDLSSLFNE